jgi:hypothetical protein
VVEYAMLIASNGIHGFATGLQSLGQGVDWSVMRYLLIGLFALLVARWAFRSSNS